ncbi:hypothetical protein ACHAXT_009314 [Thalassiosira profunda]
MMLSSRRGVLLILLGAFGGPVDMPSSCRRVFLSKLASSSLAAGSTLLYPPAEADALPFIGGPDRRQLELCLATILRTEYWAMNVAKSLQTKLLSSPTPTAPGGGDSADASINPPELTENQRKQPYLEARLGAKALLTQKIGGGANSRVLELGGFQLKECLEDAKYWCGELAKSNQLPGDAPPKTAKRICANDLAAASDDLVESLASLVEFDGLETTQDPSPRSSLTLASYNPQKGKFVYRTLLKRVVPSCERFLGVFGKEKMAAVAEYVRRDHGDEVPFEVLEKLYAAQSPQT